MIELIFLGEYREAVMILEGIVVLLCWQFMVYFLYKYYRNIKEQKITRIDLDWAIFLASFGFTQFFYQFADFYLVDHYFFSFLGYLSLGIGIFLFAFHSEKIQTIKSKWIIPSLTLLILIIFIVSYIIDPKFPQSLANLAVFPATVIIVYFIFNMFRTLRGKFRIYILGLIAGLFFLLLGNLGASDLAVSIFGRFIRVLADFFMILGICFLALFFNLIPSLSEVDWITKLKYILIIDKTGICLYDEDFREKSRLNKRLLAAALFNIREFLDEWAKGYKKLKILEKENEFFIMEYGKLVTGVLVSTELLESLKYLLRRFVTEFENFYSDILKSWSGDVKLFLSTSSLTSKIFKKIQ